MYRHSYVRTHMKNQGNIYCTVLVTSFFFLVFFWFFFFLSIKVVVMACGRQSQQMSRRWVGEGSENPNTAGHHHYQPTLVFRYDSLTGCFVERKVSRKAHH